MTKQRKRRRAARAMSPRRQLVLVALVFAAALVTGLYLPNLFAFSQDVGTDRLEERVNLGTEALRLTSSESRIERLKVMGAFAAYGESSFTDPLPVIDRRGLFLSEEEILRKLDALLDMASAAGLDTGNLTRADAIPPEPYLLLTNAASGSSLATLTVWELNAQRQVQKDDGRYITYEITMVVDDTTGMLLLASYDKSGVYSDASLGGPTDVRTAVQALADRFRQSEGLTDLTASVETPSGSNPFLTVCYIHFLQERETLYSMPVAIGETHWGINTTAFY